MGVDISMSMGWGIHIPQDVFDRWLAGNDPDAIGPWESVEYLLSKTSELSFHWPGDSWQGSHNGWVIFAAKTVKLFDMGRDAQAGVYRPRREVLTLPAQYQLNEVSKTITGKHLPIEWLVTVGVS